MTANTDHRQSWFGMIATLIYIVLIFALLMPAVQDGRTRTRNECTNRIKNLVLATVNFEKNVVSSSPKRARPNSFHPGIVMAAMADGSTVSISDELDNRVYQALMTPQTRKSDVPDVMYRQKEDDFMQ